MAVLLSPAELNSRLNVPVAVLLVPVVSLAIPTIDRRNCLSRCHTRTVASGGIERAYGAVLNRAGPDAGICHSLRWLFLIAAPPTPVLLDPMVFVIKR